MNDSSINLCSPRYVRELMDEFSIAPQKRYGQNFLINDAIPKRIAETSAETRVPCVLEIGPGIGTMTRELSELFDAVTAVEIDRDLIPVLGRTLADKENVTVINSDIMNVDIDSLTRELFGERNFAVCANLPYYITTPIIMKLLECGCPRLRSVTVMIQTEVADRLVSKAGSSEYGAITAAVAYYGQAKKLFSVSPGSFLPAPKVSSTVIKIDIYPENERPFRPKNEKLMFRIISAAFGQRRKTLPNALSAGVPGLDKEKLLCALTDMGLDPRVRGEALSVSQFAELSDRLS